MRMFTYVPVIKQNFETYLTNLCTRNKASINNNISYKN